MAVCFGMLAVEAVATQNALVKVALPGAPSTAVIITNTTQLIVSLATLAWGRGSATTSPGKENVMAGTAPNVSNDEYRMFLQLETSLLVWLRTSLGLMGFGFVIARFGLFLREIAQSNQLDVHLNP